MSRIGRRELLKVGAGFAAGASFVTGCEGPVTKPMASAPADLEATVSWIEETPRAEVFAVAGEKLAAGLSTGELLAALLVAGARSLTVRDVGLWLHPFFTLWSVERMSLAAPARDRLVPYFFGLDVFKIAQSHVGSPSELLSAFDEAAVPTGAAARDAFRAAVDAWDEPGANAAIVGMHRHLSTAEITEEVLLYGCRDLLPIGHHVISVTQVLRTLDVVGWERAETPLRALATGLMEAKAEGPTTSAFTMARARASMIREDWTSLPDREEDALAVLAAVRGATSEEAATFVADRIEAGASPRSVLDGLLLAGAELLLRFPSGGAVFPGFHALTNANGFRHVFRAANDPKTRLVAVLQAAAFYPLNRDEAIARAGGDSSTLRIDAWTTGKAPASVDAVFEALAEDRVAGAGDARAWLEAGGEQGAIVDVVRRSAILKGAEEHDYKLPVAVFEELEHVAPAFRAQILAATAAYVRLPSEPDWERLEEARDAIATALGGSAG